MTESLSLREISKTTRPSIDRRGTQFERNGRIYRAFRDEPAALIERLLGEPWLPELYEAGLIEFHRADVTVDGYSLVVEVPRIPFVTYPSEWPVAMLRDAGVLIARLGERLSAHGLGLQDAHPWNVLFRGSRPVFVDLGSIIEDATVTPAWVEEYRRTIVLPLALHGARMHGIADAVQGIERGWIPRQLSRRRFRWFPPYYRWIARQAGSPPRFYRALEHYMRGRAGTGAVTAWSEYEQTLEKEHSLETILGAIAPGRLLDVGANAGWFSRLAARLGNEVVAIDNDDRTLGSLYRLAAEEGLPVVPVRMDFMWPTGSAGFGLELRAAPDRLRCDTLVALAVLHHLVGYQRVTFESFAKVVDMFAARHAVIEFVPREDAHVAEWSLAAESWYSEDAFVAAMAPCFRLIQRLPSSPAPRVILSFERVED